MARSIDEINQQILDFLVPNMAAIGIAIDTSQWSKRNILRVICWTIAAAIAIFEQLMDAFKAEVEYIVANSPGASRLWIQNKMFEFQYAATIPQVLQLVNLVPQYVPVIPAYRIITASSVRSTVSNFVLIKVAKGNPFTALTTLELAAAQSYINEIGAAGISYVVSSSNADKLYIQADIFYIGQFASVIEANVIAALDNFLQNLSVNNFNGYVKMSDIEKVIRGVQGVNDVLLVNVRARQDSAAFSLGTDLILGQAVISRLYNTYAGYLVQETTSGKTFADSLNFIAE